MQLPPRPSHRLQLEVLEDRALPGNLLISSIQETVLNDCARTLFLPNNARVRGKVQESIVTSKSSSYRYSYAERALELIGLIPSDRAHASTPSLNATIPEKVPSLIEGYVPDMSSSGHLDYLQFPIRRQENRAPLISSNDGRSYEIGAALGFDGGQGSPDHSWSDPQAFDGSLAQDATTYWGMQDVAASFLSDDGGVQPNGPICIGNIDITCETQEGYQPVEEPVIPGKSFSRGGAKSWP